MPSFFDLQKCAHTGIASHDMTYHDRLKAIALFPQSYPSQTITGIPPLSFKANGKPLSSWSISGQTVQNGTQTPDAPIYPEFVGERTENLFDVTAFVSTALESKCTASVGDNGSIVISNAIGDAFVGNAYTKGNILSHEYRAGAVKVEPSQTYMITTTFPKCFYSFFDADFVCLNDSICQFVSTTTVASKTIITPAGCKYVYFRFGYRFQDGQIGGQYTFPSIMVCKGSTAKPYQPYGIYLPLTCGSQTTPIYLGQVQTTRRVKKWVLTGEEDITHYTISTGELFRIAISPSRIPLDVGIYGYCTHYKGVANTEPRVSGTFSGSGALPTAIDIVDDAYTTSDTFKAYLQQQYAAGTPVVVWYVLATPETTIINEPIAKIGDYVDTVASTNTGAPSIPTVRGSNTLSVGTTVQPSSMTITT